MPALTAVHLRDWGADEGAISGTGPEGEGTDPGVGGGVGAVEVSVSPAVSAS